MGVVYRVFHRLRVAVAKNGLYGMRFARDCDVMRLYIHINVRLFVIISELELRARTIVEVY